MSIGNDLLTILTSHPLAYKKLHVEMRKNLRADSSISKESISRSLQRLKKKGLVKFINEEWSITEQGEELNIKESLIYFEKLTTHSHQLLIMFDIPEKERYKRNWLRSQLKIYDYKMLQGSVWLGPGPLPKEFLNYLKKKDINKHILVFKTQKQITL